MQDLVQAVLPDPDRCRAERILRLEDEEGISCRRDVPDHSKRARVHGIACSQNWLGPCKQTKRSYFVAFRTRDIALIQGGVDSPNFALDFY